LTDKLEWKNIRWPIPPADARVGTTDEREHRDEIAKKARPAPVGFLAL
jgi:hypothetical protein